MDLRILLKSVLAATLTGLLAACANPLNQATSNRYARTCSQAEQAGDLLSAEEACYRALVNVDWGNLGEEQKSQALYNLARIKRQIGKLDEAEALLKDSLVIETRLGSAEGVKIGRRLVELSLSLAAQDKWDEAAATLTKVFPIAPAFTGAERQLTKKLMAHYSEHFGRAGDSEKAEAFANAAAGL